MSTKLQISIAVILIFLLTIRLISYFQSQEQIRNGQQVKFFTVLRQEPQIRNGRQHFTVKTPAQQRVSIITGLNPQFQYGDKIAIAGTVKTSEKNGHTFFTVPFPDLQIVQNDHNIISGLAAKIRRKAGDLYAKSLPPVSANLLLGIVFGADQDLPKEFMDALQVSGVVHVIAASGMNVTFVTGSLLGILGAILRRQVAITITIFGALFYMILAGLDPSIVRATVMSIIAFSAALLGRQNFAFGSLFLTAFLMLFFTPPLLYDVGFQLSFLATLGILSVKPVLPFGKNAFLSEDLGTTISAQIATLPVLLGVFGQYGLLSVVVNALVLWTIPLLMVIGAVGLLFGMILEPLGRIIIFTAAPILFYFEQVVSYFGSLGWVMNIPPVSWTVWVGYYLLLAASILLIKIRSKNTLMRENTS